MYLNIILLIIIDAWPKKFMKLNSKSVFVVLNNLRVSSELESNNNLINEIDCNTFSCLGLRKCSSQKSLWLLKEEINYSCHGWSWSKTQQQITTRCHLERLERFQRFSQHRISQPRRNLQHSSCWMHIRKWIQIKISLRRLNSVERFNCCPQRLQHIQDQNNQRFGSQLIIILQCPRTLGNCC